MATYLFEFVWWDVKRNGPRDDPARVYVGRVPLVERPIEVNLRMRKFTKDEQEILDSSPALMRKLVSILSGVNGTVSATFTHGFRMTVAIGMLFSFDGRDDLHGVITRAWTEALEEQYPGDEVLVRFREHTEEDLAMAIPMADAAPAGTPRADALEEMLGRGLGDPLPFDPPPAAS